MVWTKDWGSGINKNDTCGDENKLTSHTHEIERDEKAAKRDREEDGEGIRKTLGKTRLAAALHISQLRNNLNISLSFILTLTQTLKRGQQSRNTNNYIYIKRNTTNSRKDKFYSKRQMIV